MKTIIGLLTATTMSIVGSSALATTIDFEGLAASINGQEAVTGLPGDPSDNSYGESGFTFTTSSTTNNLAIWGTLSSNYFGSTALWNGDGTGTFGVTTLTMDGGGAFDLLSIDIAELYSGSGSANVTFTGALSGGGTVTQSFTSDGVSATGNVSSFETVTFSGFNNLVSVNWLQNSPFHQFDNVTVAPVPLPAAFSLLLMSLGGLALFRRRTKA